MKEVKPSSRKRPVKLPPQQSATDTSNWGERNVSAPTLDKITRKRVVREVEFIRPKDLDTSNRLILKQLEKSEAQERNKKTQG